MRRHVSYSLGMVARIPGLHPRLREVVGAQHERKKDPSHNYPRTRIRPTRDWLVEYAIGILVAADVATSLQERRSYQTRILTPDEIAQELTDKYVIDDGIVYFVHRDLIQVRL